ncbi:MAG TPA: Gfo/Idh/MocA family oxidoreductase [Vicinamibacteria bacterium]|nr:Gfo/Idh/MocA family oxidoreductase [Vicinamibacteria bacterium]
MSKGRRRLDVGLAGLGRLGRVYARDLATRIPETRLVAVADMDRAALEEVSSAYEVEGAYADTDRLLDDPKVEAVVIASPTHTHAALTLAAAERGKVIFCEKPLALSLAEALRMKDGVAHAGVFFQMGFMRRFDPGYADAKRKVEEGLIGTPVVFKSSSRDPYRTSLEYADPRSSGGMIMDMGIHDIDLARWYMGEVKSVAAVGGTLAYPELRTVGDIDNAIVSLVFADDRIGVVDLSRNGVYGYDISTELLGTEGTLRIGFLRHTAVYVMKKNNVAHDTVPHFMQRFESAYAIQLQDFARNVLEGRPPSITIDDGIAAIKVALAAERARQTGLAVSPAEVS